jgi:hypothetical protein
LSETKKNEDFFVELKLDDDDDDNNNNNKNFNKLITYNHNISLNKK